MSVTLQIQVAGVATVILATDTPSSPDQLDDMTGRALTALGGAVHAYKIANSIDTPGIAA